MQRVLPHYLCGAREGYICCQVQGIRFPSQGFKLIGEGERETQVYSFVYTEMNISLPWEGSQLHVRGFGFHSWLCHLPAV